MSRKLNKKSRATLHRLSLIVAVVFAIPTYLLVPATGRGPIGAATIAAGAIAYAAVQLLGRKAHAIGTAPRPRTRTAK
ncbi:hypothetical protein [Streptomyces sp. NPDC056491]|uniref:hypothetical protein n=1 Tax=Streptomyces sp. NPDC056491 TaxID=3345837 RepID=UPI0036AFB233